MTFIIGEVGSNYNRNFEQATALIDVAVEAKCDAVKFQTFSSETLYVSSTPDFAGYKNINKIIKDIELPRHWQKDLKMYCDDHGIEFMSTPFDESAIGELVALGVKRLKIAGFEATDPRFISLCASTFLPLIISVGIGANAYGAVEDIVEMVDRENGNPDITFLHCNNSYPTPFKDVNLGMIGALSSDSSYKVGLSDHTPGILVPPVAVGMGATYIEKHFTISRLLPGPDHHFAIEPQELKDMVANIRTIETCMGYKKGLFTESEKDFEMGTRSVVSSRNISKGERVGLNNITTKRPCPPGAVPAEDYYKIINSHCLVNRDIEEDTVIQVSHLEVSIDAN